MQLKEILDSSNSEGAKPSLSGSGKTKVMRMSKPARLYPKPEPMNPNPKMIWIGSVLFAIAIGWFGITTASFGVL